MNLIKEIWFNMLIMLAIISFLAGFVFLALFFTSGFDTNHLIKSVISFIICFGAMHFCEFVWERNQRHMSSFSNSFYDVFDWFYFPWDLVFWFLKKIWSIFD